MQRSARLIPLLLLSTAWASAPASAAPADSRTAPPPSALQRRLAAQDPADPALPAKRGRRLGPLIDAWFAAHVDQRIYIQVDKPMYQPGETIWFRVWDLAAPTLRPAAKQALSVQLVDAKGAVIATRALVTAAPGGDFALSPDADGGEYTVRVLGAGASAEHKVVVASYQAPAIQKKLELTRKAYGPGDAVAAALSLRRTTGEPLATDVIAVVTVDEAEVARVPVKTGADGKGVVKFTLPAHIARGDGLLTVLVPDGGNTESIQRRIPITLAEIDIAMYPEGGNLIAGLPGRVYFRATNKLGKPADLAGKVVDDMGHTVVEVESFHHGMGRFEITPEAGRSYLFVVTRPTGITTKVALPTAMPEGCSLQAVDDPLHRRDGVRVAVWCTRPRTVIAAAVLRGRRLGDAAVRARRGAPSVIDLPAPAGAQGAVRVTLFDDALNPLAERLVYRGRGADLRVSIKPDRATYAPRDPVTLTVTTRDRAGRPVPAELSMSVVDDTVLTFADDKSANLLARIYLESEMPGQEIEEPSFYFGPDPKAPFALDLVLGTQGWRRFEWYPVLNPPPPPPRWTGRLRRGGGGSGYGVGSGRGGMRGKADVKRKMAARMEDFDAAMDGGGGGRAARGAVMRPMDLAPAPEPAPMPAAAPPPAPPRPVAAAPARPAAAGPRPADPPRLRMAEKAAAKKPAGEAQAAQANVAVGRKFPTPTARSRDAARTDFRETIYWAPSVTTGADGVAKVRFTLSDAVTAFRATAEGVGRGRLGRGEATIQAKRPVSLAVTMPQEVSAGDQLQLPITITNETRRPQEIAISARFGAAFKAREALPETLTLRPGERRALFAPLEVVGTGARADDGLAAIAVRAGDLTDSVERTIRVVALGFPAEVSVAGTARRGAVARHEIDLAGAVPGTVTAELSLYPSPLATMVQGATAILREPTGCFEQASSANYPNVMVLDYMDRHGAADATVVERANGFLDSGYRKLVGYETPTKGYEWFGGDPGHEALTAYGLMEFVDMTRVYGAVDRTMIDRTRAWLRGRRDGQGGFQRNQRALDSFGSASPEVTDGYITWALTEAGDRDLAPELVRQKKVAAETKDPYLMALAANTLVNVDARGAGTGRALDRLVGLQKADGAFAGADHSITRSGGDALDIETTSLAVLALVDGGRGASPEVRKAVEWLNGHRNGYGNFSSTQATILALKALGAYAEASRATRAPGTVIVRVNGAEVKKLAFEAGHQGALVVDGLASALRPGKNVVEIRLDSDAELPYSAAFSYKSPRPASSPAAPVALTTALARDQVDLGEGVKLKVAVENKSADGLPMTMARVGIPGGLTFQTWQLKELVDKKLIDFYETDEREVVLYFRAMAPHARKEIDLDLLARIPGAFTAPASRAYLYYTDEHKQWVPPVKVTIRQ